DEDYDIARADTAYAQAFRDFGIDVEALTPEAAAARLRARTIPVELAAALDAWATLRREERKVNASRWQPLGAVARRVETDERRNLLRDALARRDRQALVQLAASDQAVSWPPSTLVLLGRGLRETGAAEAAVAVLRQARQRHPTDFWINHDLALSFS